MLYRQLIDQLQFSPSAASLSLTAAQTVTARIKQEPKRLEAILLVVKATNGATVPTSNCDGLAGLVKEVRIRANDVLGSRNIVQCHGPAILSWTRQNFGFVDRNTFMTYPATWAASQTWVTCYYIPIRHPMIAEPYGNLLSLPLSSNFIKDDAVLEVDLNAQATIFSANPITTLDNIKAYSILRDVPDSVPYIPSELRTDLFAPNTAAKATFEFPSVGFLTQVLIQGYNSASYSASIVRNALLTNNGQIYFEYGRNITRKLDEEAFYALNDLTQFVAKESPSGTVLTPRAFAGEYFLDFLSDLPGEDSFSAASMVNLNTEALAGDKARLTFNNWLNASYVAYITQHKILARTTDAIKPLMVNV